MFKFSQKVAAQSQILERERSNESQSRIQAGHSCIDGVKFARPGFQTHNQTVRTRIFADSVILSIEADILATGTRIHHINTCSYLEAEVLEV